MEKLGFLGPEGTHSEAAAMHLCQIMGRECQLVPMSNIYSAIRAVEKGKVDTCLVPVENSIEGSINITLDTLASTDDLRIVRELIWGVHNQLMVKDPKVPITRIISHAQPLAQCRDYIRKNFPDAELDAVISTAAAAQMVAESEPSLGWAAIGTKRAGELNGLTALDRNIEDHHNNCTRFYQLARCGYPEKLSEEKALLMCQIDGKDAGQLCRILMELATRQVNMTRIESRPARTELGEYIFFFDVDIPGNRKLLEDAIQAVEQKSLWLRTPGQFPVLRADNRVD